MEVVVKCIGSSYNRIVNIHAEPASGGILQPCPLLGGSAFQLKDLHESKMYNERGIQAVCVCVFLCACVFHEGNEGAIGRAQPSPLVVFNEPLMGNMHGRSAGALIRRP